MNGPAAELTAGNRLKSESTAGVNLQNGFSLDERNWTGLLK